MNRALLALLSALLLCPGQSAAAPAERLGAHALVDVRLVPRPGEEVPSGTLVVRNGLIEAVGAETQPPPDARLWERDGLTIYPGLIEAYSVRAWAETADPESPLGSSLVHPERDMTLRAVDPELTEELRAAGFTTAAVAPAEGIFRGWGALLNLGDGGVAENLLRRRTAQYVSLRWNSFGEDYPTSRMGATALIRQTLLDGRWHREAQKRFEEDPAQARPPYVAARAELGGAAHGEVPIVFETLEGMDASRFARLATELSLNAVLVGSGDEYRRLAAHAETGLPYILPLDFPPRPAVGDTDDLSIGLSTLRHWDLAPENPWRLLKAGAQVAFTSHRMDEPRMIFRAITAALERGLTTEQALAALTTTPAAILGLAERAGTLEPGKMANLLVVDGPLFVERPKLVEVWIDGVRYPLDVESEEADE